MRRKRNIKETAKLGCFRFACLLGLLALGCDGWGHSLSRGKLRGPRGQGAQQTSRWALGVLLARPFNWSPKSTGTIRL